ncbi:MAG: EscU/YscU/HrcU family type III secretion system export apparatus switch protein [Myxococcota bacterium]
MLRFASLGDTGEKTEEASPEKLRKAREEGQVPKSQDFVGALNFAVGFMALASLSTYVAKELKDYTVAAFDAATRAPSLASIFTLIGQIVPLILKLSLPILGIVFVIGIFSNVLQTGFFLAFKVVIPKFDKINPVNGLKGMFKLKKIIELIKNLLKVGIVAWVAYDVMSGTLWDMVLIVSQPLHEAVAYGGKLIWDFMVKVIMAFLVIGIADLLYARKSFAKEMMMSKYDVKQEYKQQEGDPHHKGERKKLAHELLFSGGAHNVKNADAVVVNPEHIAVAIKYDKEKGKAPRVVAKGVRIHAEKIKELAKQYGVPILRNVPLAQALNKLELEEEVPEELYEAVAEVLAFVYKLKEEQENRHKGRTAAPGEPGTAPGPGQAPKPGLGAGAGRLKAGK